MGKSEGKNVAMSEEDNKVIQSDADLQKVGGISGVSVFRSVFFDGEDVEDVKQRKVSNAKEFSQQIITFPLNDGLQRKFRLTPRAFVGLGFFVLLVTVALFILFFFLGGSCTESTILTTTPNSDECTSEPITQRSSLELDINGFFAGQPGFNIQRAIYRIDLNNYEGNDEDFNRDLGIVLEDLRNQTGDLPVSNHVETLERLVGLKSSTGAMVARYNIDPGHILRSQRETLDGLILYAGQEDLEISDNPASCEQNFDRLVFSELAVLPNSAENYATVRVKFLVPTAEESQSIAEPPVWAFSSQENICAADLENRRVANSALADALQYFQSVELASGEEKRILGFDVKQVFKLSQCNRDADNDCEAADPLEYPSPAGYQIFYSTALGKIGYTYQVDESDESSDTILVIPSLGSHPGVEICDTCSEGSTEAGASELCQRNVGVLLKMYVLEENEEARFVQSAYFMLRTRNIWNRKYTTEAIHCTLENLLIPVEENNDIVIPVATTSGIYECTISTCKSILERLGTATAVAELFVIIFVLVMGMLYLLFNVVKNRVRASKAQYVKELLSDAFLGPEIQSALKGGKWLRNILPVAILLLVLAIFLLFLIVPGTCEDVSALSLGQSEVKGAQCSEVLLTQNRNVVFDSEQEWETSPAFRSGNAFYSVSLRNYSATDEGFNADLFSMKEALNDRINQLEEDSLDTVLKHESLIFTSDSSVNGLKLGFRVENNAAGELSSPHSLILKIDDMDQSCAAELTTTQPYSRVGLLNRESPLLSFSIRETRPFFEARAFDASSCFPDEDSYNEATDQLLSSFESICGGEAPFRIDLFMGDIIKLDSCNREELAEACVPAFADSRDDIVLLDNGKYGMLWPPNNDFAAIPVITANCETCSSPVENICDQMLLEIEIVDIAGNDSTLRISVDMVSELPLNGFGALPGTRCSVDDVMLQPVDIVPPFATSSNVYFCNFQLCSSWISRLGASFADTDFVLEVLEILAIAMIIIFGISRSNSSWKKLVTKPLPSKTKKVLAATAAFLVSIFVVLSFVGLFAGFFVRFGRCTSTEVLSIDPQQGKDCQEILLRQDGAYGLDSSGRFSTAAGFNPRQALFSIEFKGYGDSESGFRSSLRELLKAAQELYVSLEGQTHIENYQQLLISPISVKGSEGSMSFKTNINHPFILRWINVESAESLTLESAHPLETFWFSDEDVDDPSQGLQDCSLQSVLRAPVVAEETETLMKFITIGSTAISVNQGSCENLEIVQDFDGRSVLRSFFVPESATDTFEIPEDLHIAFDSAQIVGLDYCNRDPSNCESRIRPGGDLTAGRDSVIIPVSWEVHASAFDSATGLYGYIWQTNVGDAFEQYFVVPRLNVPEGCECNAATSAKCSSQAILVLKFYRIAIGSPISYLTSLGKVIDLTGLWNSVGVSENLHCDTSNLVSILSDEMISEIADNSAIPFETEFLVYQCTQTLCSPGTERFGDAYALAKLITILLLFIVFTLCLILEWNGLAANAAPSEADEGDVPDPYAEDGKPGKGADEEAYHSGDRVSSEELPKGESDDLDKSRAMDSESAFKTPLGTLSSMGSAMKVSDSQGTYHTAQASFTPGKSVTIQEHSQDTETNE